MELVQVFDTQAFITGLGVVVLILIAKSLKDITRALMFIGEVLTEIQREGCNLTIDPGHLKDPEDGPGLEDWNDCDSLDEDDEPEDDDPDWPPKCGPKPRTCL